MPTLYLIILGCCLISFFLGLIWGWFISRKKAEGTIVIEEIENDHDLFRFDLGLDLDDIKVRKQIIFDVRVEKP